MPPNATEGSAKPFSTNNEELTTATTTTTTTNSKKEQVLKLKPNEVCIDGSVYDIYSFDHPGGDSLYIFGGNDVSIQYKMIHPYHTKRHLQKMKFLRQFSNPPKSDYLFGTAFEMELKREVLKVVPPGSEFGTNGYLVRACLYIVLFGILQYRWVIYGTSYTMAASLGVSMALIGLNVQHDANHGAASRRVWINDLFGFGADAIGGSKWLWIIKHWTHHAFTNHEEKDPDGFAAEPMILFNDYDNKQKRRQAHHSFQAMYLVLVLSLYWITSVLNITQVWDLQDRGATAVGVQLRHNKWLSHKTTYAVTLRLLHLLLTIVLPLYYNPSHQTLCHIYCMGVAGSLALGCLFTLSHNFQSAERHPTGQCWYTAQVETSCTYGGWISGYLTGGLNYQIEHHLFPRMCSAWYPTISPIVRRICKKHGVKYTYYPWLHQNMASTLSYTHSIGNGSLHHQILHHNPYKGET